MSLSLWRNVRRYIGLGSKGSFKVRNQAKLIPTKKLNKINLISTSCESKDKENPRIDIVGTIRLMCLQKYPKRSQKY